MSRRGLPASRRRVEVPNSPLVLTLLSSKKSFLHHPGASFSGVGPDLVGWPPIFGLVDVAQATARCRRDGGRGRGSAASPASGRSEFPTGKRKEAGIGRGLPTAARRFHGICGFRWGVVRACGAKYRKSSNGADFRRSESLHMTAYRKFVSSGGNEWKKTMARPRRAAHGCLECRRPHLSVGLHRRPGRLDGQVVRDAGDVLRMPSRKSR